MTVRTVNDPGTPDSKDTTVYDFIGIGFGPANLALAIAVADHNDQASPSDRLDVLFLDRRPSFSWHPGMMLPGSTMQVSFLKDLVTLRDATHPLSFLAYLQAGGRIEHFGNKQTFFPSRREFGDYLRWAAGHVQDVVRYGAEVTAVQVEEGGADRGTVVVRLADGQVLHARTLVHGPGPRPVLPTGVRATSRVFHTGDLLRSLDALDAAPRSAVVVGSGQSAAEAARYLHDGSGEPEVHAVFRKVGYTPADDSPYANRVFDAEMVDRWHAAPMEIRERLVDYHRGTNYSAVDPELIEDLYCREYEERVSGRRRLFVHGCHEVLSCVDEGDRVRTVVRDATTGRNREIVTDVAVMATGYRGADPAELVEGSGDWYRHDGARPEVERDYRWQPARSDAPDVYLNGGVEHTHGLTSSLLSNLAVRSGEIVQSLVSRRSAALVPSR